VTTKEKKKPAKGKSRGKTKSRTTAVTLPASEQLLLDAKQKEGPFTYGTKIGAGIEFGRFLIVAGAVLLLSALGGGDKPPKKGWFR